MPHHNLVDLAWAAGFYEGEGTICTSIDKAKKTHLRDRVKICCEVTQTRNLKVIDRFRSVIGFGKVRKINITRCSYSWRCYTFEQTQAFIALVWNQLSRRRKDQAIECLKKYHELRETHCG